MPPSSWPLKLMHDALQQAAANIAVLAAPLVLCAFDRTPCISFLEMVGWTGWLVAWGFERLADLQVESVTRTVTMMIDRYIEGLECPADSQVKFVTRTVTMMIDRYIDDCYDRRYYDRHVDRCTDHCNYRYLTF